MALHWTEQYSQKQQRHYIFLCEIFVILILDLRLQLLDTERNYYLLKALYGLLMLLPQSAAFILLRNRLDCVPNVHILPGAKQG